MIINRNGIKNHLIISEDACINNLLFGKEVQRRNIINSAKENSVNQGFRARPCFLPQSKEEEQ
jgi:hypothetical protein